MKKYQIHFKSVFSLVLVLISVTYKGKPAIKSDISGSGFIEAFNAGNNK